MSENTNPCSSGKVPHDTENEAWAVAELMAKKHGGIFKAYWCGECFKYHTGHLIPKRTRMFRDRMRLGLIKGR